MRALIVSFEHRLRGSKLKAKIGASAIEHKGASDAHRGKNEPAGLIDFGHAECSNSELGSDSTSARSHRFSHELLFPIRLYELATSHRQGRGRSPANYDRLQMAVGSTS